MMREENSGLVSLVSVIGVILLAAALAAWEAVALMVLWGWFIVPLGVVSISYWHAFGMTILLGLAGRKSADPKEKDMAAYFTGKVLGPGLAILFGALAHGLM